MRKYTAIDWFSISELIDSSLVEDFKNEFYKFVFSGEHGKGEFVYYEIDYECPLTDSFLLKNGFESGDEIVMLIDW